jgi:hypothetical protein
MYNTRPLALEILHIARRSNVRSIFKPKASDVLFNTILAVEMMNVCILAARVFLNFRQSTPNVMLDTCGLGNVCKKFALLLFFDVLRLLNSMRKVVGKTEKSINAF